MTIITMTCSDSTTCRRKSRPCRLLKVWQKADCRHVASLPDSRDNGSIYLGKLGAHCFVFFLFTTKVKPYAAGVCLLCVAVYSEIQNEVQRVDGRPSLCGIFCGLHSILPGYQAPLLTPSKLTSSGLFNKK